MIKRTPLGCLVVILLLGIAVFAQYPERPPRPSPTPPTEQAPQPCPVVAVQAQPGGLVRDGQRVFFTANYPYVANSAGGEPRNALTIVWNTSAGSILQGQGSNRVEVDTTGAGGTPEREVKAEVWISGYAPECVLQASATVKIIPPATKFGDFGEVSDEKLTSNLKALTDFMSQSQSTDNLYVIAYAGRNSERGFTQNWVKKIKMGLAASGFPEARVYAMDGGFREQPMFDFWIVPNGAEPPRPSPTVKRNEIVYPKTTPVKKP